MSPLFPSLSSSKGSKYTNTGECFTDAQNSSCRNKIRLKMGVTSCYFQPLGEPIIKVGVLWIGLDPRVNTGCGNFGQGHQGAAGSSTWVSWPSGLPGVIWIFPPCYCTMLPSSRDTFPDQTFPTRTFPTRTFLGRHFPVDIFQSDISGSDISRPDIFQPDVLSSLHYNSS